MNVNIKEVLRGYKGNKLTTFINLIGFTFSMAVCITIFLFVKNELDYDKSFAKADKAYRVLRSITDEDKNIRTPRLAAPYLDVFKLELEGQAEQVFRVYKSEELITYKDNSFIENSFYYTDPGFFDLWDYEFISGNPEDVLQDPNAVVISEAIAAKYFGTASPIGELIELGGGSPLAVRGVIKTDEKPTHLRFDFIASLQLMKNFAFVKDFNVHTMNLYFVLGREKSRDDLYDVALQLSNKYLIDQENLTAFQFQPFEEVYFDTDTKYDVAVHGQKTLVLSFMAIGILIVVIAIANFINLSMVQYNLKLKKVGMKKILGSNSKQLMIESLTESAMAIIISLTVAIIIHLITKQILESAYDLNFSPIYAVENLIYLILFVGVTIFLSGFYPALMTSRVQPLMVIRNQFASGPRAKIYRRALLSFQFFSTTLLIIVSLAMFQQLSLVQNTNLGFDKEQVVVFHSNNRNVYQNRTKIKEQILQIPGVQTVGLMYGGIPGTDHPTLTYQVDVSNTFQWHTALIDENFHELLGISYEAVDPAWLKNELNHDQIIVVNERVVNRLGWSVNEALGKTINVLEEGIAKERKIVGVVKDYHYQSLKHSIEPLILLPMPEWAETFAVKLDQGASQKTLSAIENVWTSTAPDYPFLFNFLDSTYDELYQRETNQMTLFVLFTVISVVLSCLGLLGISGLLVHQRRKEIGVRAVLGATMADILQILSKEFVVIVLISSLLAYPTAYLINNEWLANFAVRIGLNPMNYLFASIALVLLILGIVFVQSVRSGITNPVQNLRSE